MRGGSAADEGMPPLDRSARPCSLPPMPEAPRSAMLPATPSFRLDGRRALVTGAGRGIGLAAAAALAGQAAAVTLLARSAAEIGAVAEAIRADGGQADTLVLDVADVPAMQAAIAARPAYHAFVNNAATTRQAPFLEVTTEDFDAVLGLNLRAASSRRRRWRAACSPRAVRGSIINISSQMGHVGGPNRAVYCASKWAMEGWTKAMAIDLAPHRHPRQHDRPDLHRDAADQAVLREARIQGMGAVQDQARPARPGAGPDGSGGLPGLRRRRR